MIGCEHGCVCVCACMSVCECVAPTKCTATAVCCKITVSKFRSNRADNYGFARNRLFCDDVINGKSIIRRMGEMLRARGRRHGVFECALRVLCERMRWPANKWLNIGRIDACDGVCSVT